MPISDNDLELLETYLDQALDAGEVNSLRGRLTVEPELAAELDELRAQRSMRQAVWQAIEPDQMAADRLAWRMQGAILAEKKNRWHGWGQWQIARTGMAAAACIMLGFFVGVAGRRGQAITPAPELGQSPVAVNTSKSTETAADAGLLVPVTNEYGQVVAWQPFGNSSDAKAFTEDLHRARVPVAGPPVDVRLASDEKVVKF